MPSDEQADALLRAVAARLVGDMQQQRADVDQVMMGVTAAAVALIGGVDEAGVMLIEDGELRSVAPTAPLVTEFGKVQQRFHQGPCLGAAIAEGSIRCTDLRDEPRRQEFATAAVQLGVYSMLLFPLHTHRGAAGVLNLLGRSPRTFTPEAEAVGALLATHACVALSAIAKQHEFDSALESRDTIGQAKGILMERFGLNALRAFELLKRRSQETNTSLRDVATRFLDSLNQGPG